MAVGKRRFLVWLIVAGIFMMISGTLFVTYDGFVKLKDEYEYMQMSRNMWDGNGILFDHGPDVVLSPGFSLVATPGLLLTSDLRRLGQVVSLLSLVMSILVFYVLAQIVFPYWTDRIAATVLYAFQSNVMINGVSGKSEATFVLIVLLMTWMSVKPNRHLSSVVIFGGIWALSYLIRPEGLLIGAALWLVRLGATESVWNRYRETIAPLICLLMIMPYVFFLKEHTGRWQLSGKTYANLVLGEKESPYQEAAEAKTTPRYEIISQIHRDPSQARTATDYVAYDMHQLLSRIPINILKMMNYYHWSVFLPGLILGLYGCMSLPVRIRNPLMAVWAICGLYIFFFILPRHLGMYHWVMAIGIVAAFARLRVKSFTTWQVSRRLSYVIIYGTVTILTVWSARSALRMCAEYLLSRYGKG